MGRNVEPCMMLMSIEIDKSQYKSIASPENFVIIDFYRQIKLINRQLSSTIDLSTSFPMIDYDRHVTSCFTTHQLTFISQLQNSFRQVSYFWSFFMISR